MPKTKTIFSILKKYRISDKGNQMLAQMWRKNNSSSEAEFIRDAIAFFIQEKHPKYYAAWSKMDIPEINEFKHHDARENGLTDSERESLSESERLYEKHFTARRNEKK